MFDRDLVKSILVQINEAIDKIKKCSEKIENVSSFT